MRMPVKLPPNRKLCGTAEAADIYGCSQRHVRLMADRGEIWSKKLSERVLVVDADEIERLAKDREELRKAGKLCGRRPSGRKSA
jgi:hypothetical protein